ncbi:MAG: lipocalin family protein [Steroidobacter sp.]
MNHTLRAPLLILAGLVLAGCQTTPTQPSLQTVPWVELQRFMGDWYVIGHIPTPIEKGAYNAVESYKLNEDGTIATTFTFNQDALDGPVKKFTPKGFVRNQATNAEWGMQFAWPVKADYKIVYLDEDYQQTIVARDQRDYVWILARTPDVSSTDYDALASRVRSMGYPINLLRRVPHQSAAK